MKRLLVVFLLFSAFAELTQSAEQRPNVVLMLVDDMGWMDCGVYGSQYYETPNIDRFSDRAMRFTNAYAQPLCSPSRASILTGQYTARHGITTASGHQPPQPEGHVFLPKTAPPQVAMLTPESKNYLELSQITLAETLRSAGYRTAHIGKWHVGLTQPHWPEQQGFDVAFHCHPDPGPPGGYFSPYGVVAEGRPTGKTRVGTITDGPIGEYIVDRQAAEAVTFIKENKSSPFFLNLWCYGVHGPWGHKEEYTKHFAEKKDPSGRQGNPIMASMLKSVDDCFGRVLDELDRQGVAENTIIIFYSDNGGNQHSNIVPEGAKSANEDWQKWAGLQPPTKNTPLRDGKGTLYEGGTRVPLMWAWADKIPAGSVNDSVVGCIDIYPTLIDLLGIPKPTQQHFDGVSYAQILKGTGKLDRPAYFNYHPHAGLNRAGGVSVRSGDFKLLRWFGNPSTYELFNLSDDIGESNNLAEQMPDKTRELDALIDRFLEDTAATYPRPNPAYQPASNDSKNATSAPDAWKPRGVEMTVADGVLTVVGTGKPGTAFLGHATGRMTGPANVILKVRSATGGVGRIDQLPKGADEPENILTTPLEVEPGDWQTVRVELKSKGPLGVLRLYLPVADGPIEIDQIDIEPATGRRQVWEF